MQGDKLQLELNDLSLTEEKILAQPEEKRAALFWFVGHHLKQRFEKDNHVNDLTNAATFFEHAVRLTAEIPDSLYIASLAGTLSDCFELLGRFDFLTDAVMQYERLMEVKPDPNYMDRFANVLLSHFQQTGNTDDIKHAIELSEKAIEMTPLEGPELGRLLHTLGRGLHFRYETSGSDGLNAAIPIYERAIRYTKEEDKYLIVFLNNLSMALRLQFERTGRVDDINRAIALNEQAMCLNTDDNDTVWILDTMSTLLYTKAVATGAIDSLDLAIQKSEQAIKLDRSNKLTMRATWLNNLANALIKRSEINGSMDDLRHGVEAQVQSLDLTPSGHYKEPGRLTSMGNAFWRMFKRTKLPADLDRAIVCHMKALDAIDKGRPQAPACLNNLGNTLLERFELNGTLNDLDAAVSAYRRATDLSTMNSPDSGIYFTNLGNALRIRYESGKAADDLVQSISANERAVSSTPPDHSSLSLRLNNYGDVLGDLFLKSGRADDLDRAVTIYEESLALVTAPPYYRLLAANSAAKLTLDSNRYRTKAILSQAVHILPLLSPRSLKQSDRQYWVAEFAGMTARAVSLFLECGETAYDALELFELGRGLMARLWLAVRSDISDLESADKVIAEEFHKIRNSLDFPEDAVDPDARRVLAKQFDDIVGRIRQIPGFGRFLLGATESQLQSMAQLGPIVVFNVSEIRSDALLVEPHSIRSFHLPLLTYADVQRQTNLFLSSISNLNLKSYRTAKVNLRNILEWLWDVAVGPVLERLGFTQTPSPGEQWPRVWWIGSGSFNILPLHAAGYHESINVRNPRTALDRVISSYTPTIKALEYSRSFALRQFPTSKQKVMLVDMHETQGQKNLPFAKGEIEAIHGLLPSSIGSTLLETPTKTKLIASLADYQIVHLACHGESIVHDPSQSRLLLHDWQQDPLTVLDITSMKLESVQFAYLSACHTATVRDLGLLDESLHLVAAMQLAGYPSVIGSLWHVVDSDSAEVAGNVYSFMLENGQHLNSERAAEGLHRAIRRLRENTRIIPGTKKNIPSDPIAWGAYVHTGI